MTILFMALFVLGAVLLQNYVYEKLWSKGLTLDFAFSVREAFEGDRLYLSEELVNRKFLPLPWLLVKFQIPRGLRLSGETTPDATENYLQCDLFSVMMYKRIRRKHSFTCQKRGFYRIRRVDMLCGNLLHTATFTKQLDCPSELVVFPKPLDDSNQVDIAFKCIDGMILSNSLINPDVFEFKGIRDYLPSDSLRFVNFKASAVSQKLMVNIHAPTSSKRLEIVLNLEPYAAWADYELYEQAIRLAATMARRYIGEGAKVGLTTNGLDVSAMRPVAVMAGSSGGHLYKIYEALARVVVPVVCPPLSRHLDDIAGSEAVYAVISTYHGEDMLAALDGLEARGISALLIIPVFKDVQVSAEESERVVIWEASE
ncbi:MAG: DUF58 domain-containing protein [Defluviitaleaceae bacterium]|nr:DUF58 domain-containing protein [Defluviitaleaceae bacterium]